MISVTEAASALRDVEQTQARTRQMHGYRHASPHLILWGLIWFAGYMGTGLLPQQQWGLVWIPLDLVGLAGSAFVGMRAKKVRSSSAWSWGQSVRMVLGMVFIASFVAATLSIFSPAPVEAVLVFPAFIVGLIYVCLGLWFMPRLAWIGATVFLLSIVGFLFFKPWLPFWLAAVGGLGLVIGGFWLREA